jgi:hypothetical protein
MVEWWPDLINFDWSLDLASFKAKESSTRVDTDQNTAAIETEVEVSPWYDDLMAYDWDADAAAFECIQE